MQYKVEQCAIVLLAAGKSDRLGSPKQLLAYKGKTLLQHAAATALQTGLYPVIVVLGANSDVMKKELEEMGADMVVNESWRKGMATSLQCGLVAVQKRMSSIDGIIFMVCDQPYVTGSLLDSLLRRQHETAMPVVASKYADRWGTPALFHKSFFVELMKLSGDTGARKLIEKHEEQVATVAFPEGIVDIDTRMDYEALMQ